LSGHQIRVLRFFAKSDAGQEKHKPRGEGFHKDSFESKWRRIKQVLPVHGNPQCPVSLGCSGRLDGNVDPFCDEKAVVQANVPDAGEARADLRTAAIGHPIVLACA
jgi:hypothetical protein